MTLEEFKAHCLAKTGAEETYPFGDQAVWFKVGGKAFAWTFVRPFRFGDETGRPFQFINLKCDPARAIRLREQFAAVNPGWHQSKKHWNSVFMDGSLPDADIRSWIDHSYEIVVAALPRETWQADS